MGELDFDQAFNYKLISTSLDLDENNTLLGNQVYWFKIPESYNIPALGFPLEGFKAEDYVLGVEIQYLNGGIIPNYGIPCHPPRIIGKDYKSMYKITNTVGCIVVEGMSAACKIQLSTKVKLNTHEDSTKLYGETRFKLWKKFLENTIPGGVWEEDTYFLSKNYTDYLIN